jgi:integrase
MASMHPRRWRTKRGEPRSGYEVVWQVVVEGRLRRKRRLFSGPGAKAKAKQLHVALDAQGLGSDLTVSEAAKVWIMSREKLGRERSTIDAYQQHFDDHIAPTMIRRPEESKPRAFGAIPLDELRTSDCALLLSALLDKLSQKMVGKVMSTLRMSLGHAAASGLAGRNVAGDVRVQAVDRGEDQLEIPTPEEFDKILEVCRTHAPAPPSFAEVWTVFGVMTGLRPSEQRALPIEDLELEGKRPGFQVRLRADKWQQIGPVKTAKSRRWIVLGPSTVGLLRRWLLVIPRSAGFEDPARPGRRLHPLFPTADGTIQSLANIHNRVWQPLMHAAGLTHPATKKEIAKAEAEERAPIGAPLYSINCRRHLAASIRIDEGWDVKRVADFLGHRDPTTTLRVYAHLFRKRERQQDDAAAIERKLLG